MGLFLDDKDDITRLHVRRLIGLVGEDDLLVVCRTLFDVHLKHFPLLLDLELLAFTIATTTRTLGLLDHGTHTDNLDLDAPAVAVGARSHGLAGINHLAVDCQFAGSTIVQLVKSGLDSVDNVLTLPLTLRSSASSHTTAKQGLEHVSSVSTTHARAILHTLLAELVILAALVLVGEDLVRASDLLELLLITSLVWMVLDCQLPVCL